MYQYSFEKLEVYKNSRNLTSLIYRITDRLPSDEKFGLTNQIRRAAVSICLNLAEGSCRFSTKEKSRFFEVAYGSLMEVVACLDIASDLNYITEEQVQSVKIHIFEISNKINALKRSLDKST